METGAVEDPKIELSPESWQQSFGLDNSIDTPLGKVKMGEGQYAKLIDKKRTSEFGMLVQTLTYPDVVFIEPSEAKNKQTTERKFSYVFVKTFIRDGKKIKYFTSVTVLKDGMEISVSSHLANKSAISKKLQEMERVYTKESLLPNSSERHLAEHPEDVPDLLPTQGTSETIDKGNKSETSKSSGKPSARKDTSLQSNKQTEKAESSEITKPWSEMNGAERLAETEKHPLTKEEIENADIEEEFKAMAKAYLDGQRNTHNTLAYLKAYENVRTGKGACV